MVTTEGASPEQSKGPVHFSMISSPEEIQACFANSHGTEVISDKRLSFAHSVVAFLHQAMLQGMISSTAPAPRVCIPWIVFPGFHLPVDHGHFDLARCAYFQLEQRMFVFWLSMHVLGPHQLECTFIFRSWFPRFFTHLGFVGFSSSSFHPLVPASHPFVTVCFHGDVVHRIRRPFALVVHRRNQIEPNESKDRAATVHQMHPVRSPAPSFDALVSPESGRVQLVKKRCICSVVELRDDQNEQRERHSNNG